MVKTLFATSLYLLITCLTSVDASVLKTVLQSVVSYPGFPDGRCISPVNSPEEPGTDVSLSVIYFELLVKHNF